MRGRLEKYGLRVDYTEDLNEGVLAEEGRRLDQRRREAEEKRLNQRRQLLEDFHYTSTTR